jgi:hypothetical protein
MRNLTQTSVFSLRNVVFVMATAMACGSALAQWQWLDASGRKVYSDTAPPQSIPDKSILKRPGAAARTQAQDSAAQGSPVAPPAEIKPQGADPKLEAKRKAAEEQEAKKRREAEGKLAAARADNCVRAKSSRATIQLGTRIQTVNAKGEREIMDDAARAAESKRLDGIVASDCGPLPTKAASSPSSGQSRP